MKTKDLGKQTDMNEWDEGFRLECYSMAEGEAADLEDIAVFDPAFHQDSRRRRFLRRAVEEKNLWVMFDEVGTIMAYGVFDHTFYQRGFVHMIHVHPEYRRQGIAFELMEHFEMLCDTDKIFTSARQSNLAAAALYEKLGYRKSGILHDLAAEEDPEIVYVKDLMKAPFPPPVETVH